VWVPALSLASSCAIARVKLKQASSKQNINIFMFFYPPDCPLFFDVSAAVLPTK
jgi:hypothetical protein